jgi:hypothetical protein
VLSCVLNHKPGLLRPEALSYSDKVPLPGGTFRMGWDHHYQEEAPVHRVTVGPLWTDRPPVTNRKPTSLIRIRSTRANDQISDIV